MDHLKIATAKKIPADIRNSILDNQVIDNAVNAMADNSPMQYLFDVYEFFIDKSGEFNDWGCSKCRGHILAHFKDLKPFFEQLRNEKIKHNNAMQ